MEAVFKPIGKATREGGRFFIQLEEKYLDAVLGLEDFGHIQAVWWFHLYDNEQTRAHLVSDSPYKGGPEKIGVLATRGPVRPNPIAITVCELIAVDRRNGRIEVNYLDAEPGTPVLDIKPYHPSSDKVRDVRMPAWCADWPGCYEESGAFDWSGVFNFES
jgi:tRNA-Thr(GGU) m(6)t(6)A37 methyltransferase TsaA